MINNVFFLPEHILLYYVNCEEPSFKLTKVKLFMFFTQVCFYCTYPL